MGRSVSRTHSPITSAPTHIIAVVRKNGARIPNPAAAAAPVSGPMAFEAAMALASSPKTTPSRPFGVSLASNAVSVARVPPMANPLQNCQKISVRGSCTNACGR